MKRLIARSIVIGIILLIVISFIAGAIGDKKKQAAKDRSDFAYSENPHIEAEKKALEEMKKEPSDIKGLTKYEKYKKGLNPADGSDTDGDGLTDKDEIEKYGTDPHKMSTSGDLYTDGEKVKEGLPLNKKNKFKGKITYSNNMISDIVKLHTSSAYGRFASVADVTGMDTLKGKNVYGEYVITHFEGTLSINVKKAAKDNKTDADKLTLYIAQGSGTAKPAKVSAKGDTLSVDNKLEENMMYIVYVTDKDIINLRAKAYYNAAIPEFGSRGFDGIAYGSPLLNMVSGELNVRYLKNSNSEIERNEKEALVLMANESDSADMTTDSRKVKPATQSQIDRKYTLLKRLLPFCNGQTDKDNPMKLLFWYDRLDNAGDYLTKDDMSYLRRDMVSSGFDVDKNAFPFQNLAIKDVTDGVCAGYASYTALMYNEGDTPYKYGSLTLKDNSKLRYDIRGDAFKDMRTSKLHKFKDADYINDHKDKNGYFNKNLSEDDENFKNAMAAYWAKTNNACTAKDRDVSRFIGISSTDGSQEEDYLMIDIGYNYDAIQWMKDRIKSGKIVTIGSTLGTDRSSTEELRNGEEGHSINLYGYTDFDNGMTVFNVYDNNFPGRKDLTMTVYKYGINNQLTFFFKYQPVIDGKVSEDYIMTNMKTGKYWFDVIDERTFTDIVKTNQP